MGTYQSLQQKALGLAFIGAPLLLVIGSAAYILGIGVTPFGTDSWVDGVFMAFGFLLMIPVVLELSRVLGERAPVIGLISAILGMGWGMSIVAAFARNIQMSIVELGLNESIWTVLDASPGAMFVLLPSLLSIIGLLLLGGGLLWKGGIPRWAAGLLMVGAVSYFAGVAGGADIAAWQTMMATPLANVIFLVTLAPIGLRYLSSEAKGNTLELATA